jgi:hypothetical protein
MPSAEFEPTIPAVKRLHTDALDRTTISIGKTGVLSEPYCRK